MKNLSFLKTSLFTSGILFLSVLASAQTFYGNRNWVSKPFEDKAFIVNKGQFDGKDELRNSQIYYGVNNMGTQIYFTSKGLSYRFDHYELIKGREGKKEESREEREMQGYTFIEHMEWVGANPNVKINVEGKLEQYYNFQKTVADNATLYRIPAYKKLTYVDLYPGIDVEYTFPDKGGIKYTFIVHPGADASKIQMKYSGDSKVALDNSGNLLLSFKKIGSVTDHAPVSFYQADNAAITTSFVLNGNTVSFQLGNYDNTKTVVIDPWTVSPGFVTQNKGYDCAKNAAGDIYVFGGSTPYQLRKFNGTNGNLIWSFTANNLGTYYGDMALDVNGNIYLTEGCCSRRICKLDPTSAVKWNNTTGSNFRELWRLGVSCKTPDIVLAGGDPGTTVMKVGKMDTTSGNITQTAVVGNGSEIRCIGIDPLGDIYTMHVTTGGGSGNSGNTATNDLVRANPAFTTTWNVSSGYTLDEYCALYVSTNNFNGINGIAFHTNCIYTYNGATLNKRQKSNGNLVTTAVVAGATLNRNGGIGIDGCGNVYVGTQTGISKYDSALTFLSSISTTTEVYDLYVGLAGEIVATGNGFLGSYAGLTACNSTCGCPAKAITQVVTKVTCPGGVNGAASVTATGGTGAYTYSWSNGQTGQSASGLSAGNYAVSVNDSIGCNQVFNIIVPQPAVINPVITPTNVLCNGNTTGVASASTTGGTGAYTYSWNNGQTSSSATGLSAGTYTLTVTDSSGCTTTQTQLISQPLALAVVDSSVNISCNGNVDGTSTAIVSGGVSTFSYSWSNGQTTQTATGLGAGTYTVIITDANNCTRSHIATIFQPNGMTLTVNGGNLCNGQTGTASAFVNGGTGAYTYSWNNGQTTQQATGLAIGNYTVTITDANGCTKTATVALVQSPNINLTSNSGSICEGECINLTATASGGTGTLTYSWNPGGQTGTTINVCPTATTTYTITVTDALGCTRTQVSTVTVNPKPTASFTANPLTGQIPLNVTFTNTSTGGSTYSWTFGDGNSSTSQNTSNTYTQSGTYNPILIVTSSAGCKDTFQLTIIADGFSIIIVPNVFSPNGDGYNETFLIESQGIKDMVLEIYDRWGLLMSTITDVKMGWDGKSKSGKDAPEGTYYYLLKAHGIDSKEYDMHGYLLLLRK